MQRAAAALPARNHDLVAVLREHGRGRAVVRPEDRLLHASGEERHPSAAGARRGNLLRQRRPVGRRWQRGQERLPRRERARQDPQEPARAHEPLEPCDLVETQRRRHQRERPRRREEQPEVQPSDGSPHGAARALALDLRPRRLDEPAVGNAGRADGLARPTVEAERQMLDGRVREVDAPLRERLDEDDPPARRVHLGAQEGEGRAGAEAEPAVHALVHAVDREPVEPESRRGGGRGQSVRPLGPHHMPPTKRPALRMPFGSSWRLMRCMIRRAAPG